MSLAPHRRFLRAALSAALGLVVGFAAPGAAPYEAAAQAASASTASAARGPVAPIALAAPAFAGTPGARILLAPSLSAVPLLPLAASAPTLPALAAPAAARPASLAIDAAAAAPDGEKPASAAASAPAPATNPAAPAPDAGKKSPVSAQRQLDAASPAVELEDGDAAPRLDGVFAGARRRLADAAPRIALAPAAARLGSALLSPWRVLRDTGRAVHRMSSGDPESREFLAAHRGTLWKARLMHMLDVPITLFTAWGLGQLIDMADKGHQVPGALVPFIALSGAMVVSVLVELANDLLYMLKTNYMTYDFVKSLRTDLFRRLMRFPQKYFDKDGNDPESLANRISEDVHHAETKSIDIPIRAPVNILAIVGGAAMLAWTGWHSLAGGSLSPLLAYGIVGLLTAVMIGYGLLSAKSGRKLETLEEGYQTKRAAMVAHAQQALSSREVYLAMGLEDQAISLFDKQAEELSVVGKSMTRVEAKYHFAERVLGLFSTDLLITFAIAWSLFFLGVPSVGLITAITRYADSIASGAEGLASDNTAYKLADGGTKKIDEMRKVPLDVDAPDAADFGALKGRIEFRNVTFRYGDGTPALQNVSFTIEPGESVALVGASGSGKSTVLKLLTRLYRPDEGQILVDGADISKIKIGGLRGQLAIVPQESGLFDASVERNLLAAKPSATSAEIEAALRAAGARELLLKRSKDSAKDLATGLAANVNEFSGGQKQRLAIARALLRNSSLLLLDEWASALDQENEKQISRVLNALRQGRTTIIVDHKLHFDKTKTKIILMQDGRVVDVGLHRALLARNPVYADIVKAAKDNLQE